MILPSMRDVLTTLGTQAMTKRDIVRTMYATEGVWMSSVTTVSAVDALLEMGILAYDGGYVFRVGYTP